jgi:hypothetical protein
MAENIVVKDQLTNEMIEAGADLTRKLDELGVPIDAALWFFSPEINEWRLLFASPELDVKGPREVYRKVHAAIEDLGEQSSTIPLSLISLLGPTADLLQLLRAAVHTGPGIHRIRFTRNMINGRFIEDAFVYRVA